jgi:hypothetical protein
MNPKAPASFHKYTFHSLRHSFVSELANAGIAPDVRQLLAGCSRSLYGR